LRTWRRSWPRGKKRLRVGNQWEKPSFLCGGQEGGEICGPWSEEKGRGELWGKGRGSHRTENIKGCIFSSNKKREGETKFFEAWQNGEEQWCTTTTLCKASRWERTGKTKKKRLRDRKGKKEENREGNVNPKRKKNAGRKKA